MGGWRRNLSPSACWSAHFSSSPSAVRAQAPSGQAGVTEHDAVIRNVTFTSGEKLDEVRLHYRTLGTLQKDAQGRPTNAVLILHGTGGTGAQFLSPQFAKELFGAGQLLDTANYFLILPDNIGHGKSSKPSDGLRMRFPKYGYQDMVKLQYQLITEHLKIDHLRLVMGTSMGGMHTWMWATRYPQMADGWVPLASVPTAIVGRNRMWRTMLADAIKDDPEWQEGEYQTPPLRGIRAALRLQSIMGSVPLQWHTEFGPTREKADEYIRNWVTQRAGNARRERHAVSVRLVARLRSVGAPRTDPRAGAGDQFGRRSDQSAGAGLDGEADAARRGRQIRADPDLAGVARPQLAHVGRVVDGRVPRVPDESAREIV